MSGAFSILIARWRTWLRIRTPGQSPERRFDRLLTATISEFNDLLDVGAHGRPEGAARAKLKDDVRAIATRLETLTPPTAKWQGLIDDYIELMTLHLRHFGEVLPEDVQRQFAETNHRATIRREALREAYRSNE
jgi:hypothetical protein